MAVKKKEYTKPEFTTTSSGEVTVDDFGQAIASQDMARALDEAIDERDSLRCELDKANAELENLREGIIRSNDLLTQARNENLSLNNQLYRVNATLKDLRQRKADIVEQLHATREELEWMKHRNLWQRIRNVKR